MDSFAWHEAEVSLMKATAAKFVHENPGTDLSSAKQHPTHVESDDDPPQSGMEAQRLSQLAELMSISYLDLAIADHGSSNNDLPQQTQETQNVENQAALQTSHHDIVAPEHNSQGGNAASAGATVAKRHLDNEKDNKTTGSKPSKAFPFGGVISTCETCRRRKLKCDQGQPSCGRCKSRKEECIYTLKPDTRFHSQVANMKQKGQYANSASAGTTVAERYSDDEKDYETTDPKPSRASSCVSCQKQKLKCDQGLPTCGRCGLKKDECIYVVHFNDQRFYSSVAKKT